MTVEPLEIETEGWRDGAGLVLANWRTELTLVFGEWRAALRRSPQDLVTLQVSPGDVVAKLPTDGAVEELGPFARDAAGADDLANRLAQAGFLHKGRADCILQIADASVLRSQIRLPKTSHSALRGALGFELKRFSPVPPADLYFDFAVTRRDAATNRVELGSRAVRRRVIDEALAFAANTGLSVAAIRLGADDRFADWRIFPITPAALLRQLWKRWGSAALAALALLLLLATGLAAFARSGEQSALLGARIAAEQPRALLVARIERKAMEIQAEAAFVTRLKAQPGFTATVAALSDALPDGTWLTSLQIADGTLHLQGNSHTASELLGLLDRSGRFRNARFGAPLVRDMGDGTERFDITADIVGPP